MRRVKCRRRDRAFAHLRRIKVMVCAAGKEIRLKDQAKGSSLAFGGTYLDGALMEQHDLFT